MPHEFHLVRLINTERQNVCKPLGYKTLRHSCTKRGSRCFDKVRPKSKTKVIQECLNRCQTIIETMKGYFLLTIHILAVHLKCYHEAIENILDSSRFKVRQNNVGLMIWQNFKNKAFRYYNVFLKHENKSFLIRFRYLYSSFKAISNRKPVTNLTSKPNT